MAQENPLNWEKEPFENYLDEHSLYRGIHRNIWIKWPILENIQPHFFYSDNAEEGLSMDWSKYSTPEDTLKRLREPNLETNGIIDLNVEKLRNCIEENSFPLIIVHDPIKKATKILPINRAHTLIHGINGANKAKIRRIVSKIAEWAPEMKPIIRQSND